MSYFVSKICFLSLYMSLKNAAVAIITAAFHSCCTKTKQKVSVICLWKKFHLTINNFLEKANKHQMTQTWVHILQDTLVLKTPYICFKQGVPVLLNFWCFLTKEMQHHLLLRSADPWPLTLPRDIADFALRMRGGASVKYITTQKFSLQISVTNGSFNIKIY